MNKPFFFILIVLLLSCQKNKVEYSWKAIYKNDKQGNTLAGSKSNVVNAIRNGADIKIGWGSKGKNHSIEHLSTPIWIAILDEQEVIAHLDPQILSSVNWDTLSADYSDATKLKEEWRVVITTKGTFDAVWYDRENDTLIKRVPQNHTMTWFSKKPIEKTKALFSN